VSYNAGDNHHGVEIVGFWSWGKSSKRGSTVPAKRLTAAKVPCGVVIPLRDDIGLGHKEGSQGIWTEACGVDSGNVLHRRRLVCGEWAFRVSVDCESTLVLGRWAHSPPRSVSRAFSSHSASLHTTYGVPENASQRLHTINLQLSISTAHWNKTRMMHLGLSSISAAFHSFLPAIRTYLS
jgi:hypothetical protein